MGAPAAPGPAGTAPAAPGPQGGPGAGLRLPRPLEGRWRLSYPFRSRFLARPDGPLHYLDEGEGRPVVFVHGNPTWSFMWRAPVLALKGNRRAIAFDQLGMGLSGRPGRALRLADRAADLAALLGTLCPEGPVSLVGHDWGGPVALSWAVANPGRVASLCLLNTGLRVPEGAGLPRALLPFRRAGALGAFLAGPCGLFTRALARSGTLRPLPPEAREGLLAPYSRACHRKAVADFVADIPLDPRHPSWGALSAILDGLPALRGVPTLLVWGLRDFVFSEPFLRDMESLLPQSQTLALPLSGHWCLEDEPGRIVQALSGFLRDGP